MSPRTPPTADWKAPANADLLKHGADSAHAPADATRPWVRTWRRLPTTLTRMAASTVFVIGIGIYMTGGVDATVSALLRKDVLHGLPGRVGLRSLAVDVAGRRGARPEVLEQLARMAHFIDATDPLWTQVVQTSSSLLAQPLPTGDPAATLAALDAATARAVNRPLSVEGIFDWRDVDPYFVVAIDEMASADPSRAAHRFNSIRPPDGLPTGEWYLDELVRGFGDTRPIAFDLVADSTGDGWVPMALPPDQVPAHARRIHATTVGEALRVGLWGLDEYRPATPDVDIDAWWTAVAVPRGLPPHRPQP